TTTAATRRGLRLLDLQPPPFVVTPVETRDSFLRPLVRCHLDEPESARAAGVAICHHGRGGHLTDLGEEVTQLIVGRREWEATDEKFLWHETAPCTFPLSFTSPTPQ